MLHIFETELVNNKSVFYALLSIYGIGKYRSFFICERLGFAKNLTNAAGWPRWLSLASGWSVNISCALYTVAFAKEKSTRAT